MKVKGTSTGKQVKIKIMSKSLQIFITVAVFATGIFCNKFVEIDHNVPVRKSDTIDTKSNLGAVYGSHSCGGHGKFVQWRVEDCPTTDSHCRLPVDGATRKMEIEFVPSSNVEQLGLRIVYIFQGKEPVTVYDKVIENSGVETGVPHTVTSSGRLVDKNLQGKTLTAQCYLYRIDNGETETCVEADFELY